MYVFMYVKFMYCLCKYVCMYVFMYVLHVCICMYVRVNFCGGSDTGDAATNASYRHRQPLSTSQVFSSVCTKPVPSQTVYNP